MFSHFHHDHIQGLPFNGSVFAHQEDIFLASALVNRSVLRNLIQTYFSGGYFPVDIVTILKQLKFSNISTIQKMLAPNLSLEVFELNHPGGSMGYSLQSSRGKFTYLLDNEYLEEQLPFLLKFVEGSDFVLWDGMFTDHELANGRKGWGHSSIEQACSFAELAEIKKLAISHHSPARTDQELDMLSETLTSDKVSFAIQNTEVTI